MSSALNVENLESRLIEAQVKGGAQDILNEMFNTPGMSALDLVQILQRPAWQPLLAHLKINQAKSGANDDASKSASFVRKVASAPEPTPVESAKIEEPKDIDDSVKATVRGGDIRKVLTYTPEQKMAQRKLIWVTVEAKNKTVTTPEIIRTVSSKYPEINSSVVRGMIKDLVAKKHLKRYAKKGVKTIVYGTGTQAL